MLCDARVHTAFTQQIPPYLRDFSLKNQTILRIFVSYSDFELAYQRVYGVADLVLRLAEKDG